MEPSAPTTSRTTSLAVLSVTRNEVWVCAAGTSEPVPSVRGIRSGQHDLEAILSGVAGTGHEPGAKCRAEERLQFEHRRLLFRHEQQRRFAPGIRTLTRDH